MDGVTLSPRAVVWFIYIVWHFAHIKFLYENYSKIVKSKSPVFKSHSLKSMWFKECDLNILFKKKMVNWLPYETY